MALFGEKYDDEVRVLRVWATSRLQNFVVVLNVSRTGDIGLLKIVVESGIAAGIRRIEAVTGEGALAFVHKLEQQAQTVASMLKGDMFSIAEQSAASHGQPQSLRERAGAIKAKLASAAGASLLEQVQSASTA